MKNQGTGPAFSGPTDGHRWYTIVYNVVEDSPTTPEFTSPPSTWSVDAYNASHALDEFWKVHSNPYILVIAVILKKEVQQVLDLPLDVLSSFIPARVYHFMYDNEFGLFRVEGTMSHDYVTARTLVEAKAIFWDRHQQAFDQNTGRGVELYGIKISGASGMLEDYNPPRTSPPFASMHERWAMTSKVFQDPEEEGWMSGNSGPFARWDLYQTKDHVEEGPVPPHVPPPAGHPQLSRFPDAVMVHGSSTLIRAIYGAAQMLVDEGSLSRRSEIRRYADAITQIVHHSMEYNLEHGAPVTRHEDSQLYGYARDAAMFFRFMADGDNGCWKERSIMDAVTPQFGPSQWDIIRSVQAWGHEEGN